MFIFYLIGPSNMHALPQALSAAIHKRKLPFVQMVNIAVSLQVVNDLFFLLIINSLWLGGYYNGVKYDLDQTVPGGCSLDLN